jgi:hypothetical protein
VVCLGGKWLSLAGFGGVSDSKSMKLTLYPLAVIFQV